MFCDATTVNGCFLQIAIVVVVVVVVMVVVVLWDLTTAVIDTVRFLTWIVETTSVKGKLADAQENYFIFNFHSVHMTENANVCLSKMLVCP